MIINYVTEAILPGTKANKIAILNMLKEFAKNKNVKKVNFYYMGTGVNLPKNNKIKYKALHLPFYHDPIETGKDNYIRKLYRLIFAHRIYGLYIFFNCLINNENIYVRGIRAAKPVFLASLFTKKRYVIELQNFEFERNKVTDFIIKKVFKRAKRIVCVSPLTKRNWLKNGIDDKKITVLYSGTKKDFFKYSKNPRKELNIPINKKIILYAGSSARNRGSHLIFEIASKFDNNHLFVILGDTINYPEKYPKNLILKGKVPHDIVALYMQASDIFCAPYLKTNLTDNHISPLKVFEYLVFNKPIITSDLAVLKKILKEFEGLFYFSAGNKKEFINAIKYALKNKKKIYNTNKINKYTWTKRAEKIIQLINEHR